MNEGINRTDVAKKLVELRESRGIKSSKQVALALGFSESAYRKYETDTVPPAQKLAKIAEYFGVSIDYLMAKEGEASQNDYEFEEVGGADERIPMSNGDDYEPVKNDLGKLSETEIVMIKKFRAISDADKIDVTNYLSDKEDEN